MFLILGDQLFYDKIKIIKDHKILMIESKSLFSRFSYHKAKITYMLSCMREFRDYLISKNFDVNYFTVDNDQSFDKVLKTITDKITLFEPSDKQFRLTLYKYFELYNIEFEVLDNPNFLTSNHDAQLYLEKNKDRQLKMQNFYIYQRNKLGILMVDKKPFGNKYSFDEENRLKLPKNHDIKNNVIKFKTKNWTDAYNLTLENYANNPGEIENYSFYPLNFEQANIALDNFFDNRLDSFGDYEDALSDKDNFLYHSVLSPCINNGILNPSYILDRLNAYLIEKKQFSIYNPETRANLKLNSIEGYIRQIIGWREWVKIMSEFVYKDKLKNYNFFGSYSKLPEYFWSLELDEKIPYPIFKTLSNLKKTGYNHHIERLMVLANFMTINTIDPMEMYNWFMSMYVDAYPWVMIPNVFGMGSFADGGIYASKPYISGGNYIKKMSDYKNSKEWEGAFTDKFWEFMMNNEKYFKSNYRLNMLIQARKRKINAN